MADVKELERSFITQMKARKEELSFEISRCDLAITDIMHYLENEKCDAIALVKASKKLKEIRQKRRVVKIEREQVLCLLRSISSSNIAKYEKRTSYTYRTNVMDDIRHKN